jgi:HK97 family phage prohead protease
MKNMENRDLKLEQVEVRKLEDNGLTLSGYAAVFNSESRDLGGFIEVIDTRAFDKTLEEGPDVVALAHHNYDLVLGRKSAGTLRLERDGVGVKVSIDMPNTSYSKDIAESVKRGDIYGMSFGFTVDKEDWDLEAEMPLRTLEGVTLYEVSVVTEPAYPETSVALRNLEQVKKSLFKEPRRRNEARLKKFKK